MKYSEEQSGDSGWDRGWEEHRRRQLIRISKLTLAQKLQWLEDMQVLYDKLARARMPASKAAFHQE